LKRSGQLADLPLIKSDNSAQDFTKLSNKSSMLTLLL